ncbi:MAG TPA: hypothetical protein VMR34_00940 [Candidatus Saccharimonadales bacterium]|nr:hypothetical protein [Candidatus Saccharimonadales bacterium]
MKKAKSSDKLTDVVVASFPVYRKRLFIASLVVIAFVVMAGGVLYLNQQADLRQNQARLTKLAQSDKPTPAQEDQTALQLTNLETTINQEVGLKKYQAAISLINDQSDRTSRTDQSMLAGVYDSEGNYTSALAIYAQLYKSNTMTASTAAEAGAAAQAVNNKQLAVTYYKLAIALTMKIHTNPLSGRYIEYYTNLVNQLEGS